MSDDHHVPATRARDGHPSTVHYADSHVTVHHGDCLDACRIPATDKAVFPVGKFPRGKHFVGDLGDREYEPDRDPSGRWPANVVLDEHTAALLDQQSGERPGMALGLLRRGATTGRSIGGASAYGDARPQDVETGYGDTGGASRFFYTAKAPSHERPDHDGTRHPTVKPLDLMRWLVRLVTPPGGLVLDPFAGSGTTGEACVIEGFRALLIEREADYLPLIVARLTKPIQPTLDGFA